MLRLLKTVLLYLSMLVIPAQGYAASTMLFCGPAPQRVKTGQEFHHHSARSHVNVLPARHQAHVAPLASVDALGCASSVEAVEITSSDRGPVTDGELAAHESSEHAACSVAAAISASGVRFQPAEQAIERIALNRFVNTDFVTDGPRRPPRSFPA